jgi:SAP domain
MQPRLTSVTRQYGAVASHASQAVEKAADSWTQGVRRLTALVPAVPEVDLVPAVERYFDFVQRAVDVNRGITLRWARAAGTLTGVAREQTQSAGRAVRERAESMGDVARERAESMGDVARERAGSFEQAAAGQAEQAEQIRHEVAREARNLERARARQAHQQARERYEGLTKAELSDLLAERGLPKTGTVNELVERLVKADGR